MRETPDMHGKRCVITGATNGIGRATALALAAAGAELTLVGRSAERAADTCRAIGEATPAAKLDVVTADLGVQAQVREAAARLLSDPRPIDVLINNAGVTHLRYSETPDGIETSFAVNHLAYFLLTTQLLPRIRETRERRGAARIVNVASHAHRFGHIDFENLDHESDFGWMKVYGQSKLANVLFTFELARRLEGSGVTANCLHPGGVRTGLGAQSAPRLHRAVMWLAIPFLRTPEQGAATSVYLASSPEVEGVSGRYFANCKPARVSKEAQDPGVAARLWQVSEQLTRGSLPS